MFNSKNAFKLSVISSLILSSSAFALEKPKSMDDMWKIIEAQQKQIEALQNIKSPPEEIPVKTTTTSATNEVTVKMPAVSNEVKTLERKTDVLSQEVEKLRTNLAIPEEAKYKSMYGLGPAASKVYQVGKGLSIGGYGEGSYQANVADKGNAQNNADLERMVLYIGYKFSDKILLNTEIEYEHASTGEGTELKGEAEVEFASLDFFIDPIANVRTGLMLMPMGLVNRIHEPLFYFGNHRPEVEQRIIPSTWREMGAGLFGAITPNLTYTAYVTNGLNGVKSTSAGGTAGFSSDGIVEGRGGGSFSAAENFGYIARMDYDPSFAPGLTVGGSGYVGKSGQNQQYLGQKINAFTQLYETHVQWKYRGLEFRALGSWGFIGDAALLSAANGQTVGSQNYGYYTELGYDILPLILPNTTNYLAPFVRYEKLNTLAKIPTGLTSDFTKDWQIFQIGLQYKPIPTVVIKADYRNYVQKQGTHPDDFNLGFGFIF